MADKVASDESQLTTAALVAHLRLNTGLDLAVSHQADIYTAAADRIEALERALATARTALGHYENRREYHPVAGEPEPDYSKGMPFIIGDEGRRARMALTEIAGVMDAEPL